MTNEVEQLEKSQKTPFSDMALVVLEGIILLLTAFIIILGGYRCLLPILGGVTSPWVPSWFISPQSVFGILGCDVLWVAAAFLWRPKQYTRLKIYLTTIILSVSTAVAASLLVVQWTAGCMH